jgi:hypothetical protein
VLAKPRENSDGGGGIVYGFKLLISCKGEKSTATIQWKNQASS